MYSPGAFKSGCYTTITTVHLPGLFPFKAETLSPLNSSAPVPPAARLLAAATSPSLSLLGEHLCEGQPCLCFYTACLTPHKAFRVCCGLCQNFLPFKGLSNSPCWVDRAHFRRSVKGQWGDCHLEAFCFKREMIPNWDKLFRSCHQTGASRWRLQLFTATQVPRSRGWAES